LERSGNPIGAGTATHVIRQSITVAKIKKISSGWSKNTEKVLKKCPQKATNAKFLTSVKIIEFN
jgi:hypothetical protein